jgi:hypothetical protein
LFQRLVDGVQIGALLLDERFERVNACARPACRNPGRDRQHERDCDEQQTDQEEELHRSSSPLGRDGLLAGDTHLNGVPPPLIVFSLRSSSIVGHVPVKSREEPCRRVIGLGKTAATPSESKQFHGNGGVRASRRQQSTYRVREHA